MIDRHRILAIVAAVSILLVLVFGLLLLVVPVLEQGVAANAQSKLIATSNQASRASIAALKAKSAQKSSLSQKLTELSISVPASAEVPLFVRKLVDLSERHSVALTNLVVGEAGAYAPPAPSAPASHAGSSAGGATAQPSPPARAGVAKRIVSMPVKMTVTGSFASIMAFVGGVQKAPRLYLVSAIAVNGSAKEPADYSVDITGSIYFLLGSSAAAAPQMPAPPTPQLSSAPRSFDRNMRGG